MGRPAKHSVDFKARVVLSVLRGEMTGAEVARRHGVLETSIGKWKEQFVAAGRAGRGGPVRRAHWGSRRGWRRMSRTSRTRSARRRSSCGCCAVRRVRGSLLQRAGGDARRRELDGHQDVRAGRHPPLDVVSVGGPRARRPIRPRAVAGTGARAHRQAGARDGAALSGVGASQDLGAA
jgi:transposase-like protein